MKLSFLSPLIFVLVTCSCSASATEASLILVNARVWTENPGQPSVIFALFYALVAAVFCLTLLIALRQGPLYLILP